MKKGRYTMPNKILEQYITCECQDPAHVSRIWFINDPNNPELYWEVQLNPIGLFKRIKNSIFYILGTRPKFGHDYWDCGGFDKESAKAAVKLFNKYIRAMSKPNTVAIDFNTAATEITTSNIDRIRLI